MSRNRVFFFHVTEMFARSPLLYILASPTLLYAATLNLRCDNSGTADLSVDNGTTWTEELSFTDWGITMTLEIPNPDTSTVVRCNCIDKGSVGGFMSTIQHAGSNYSTSNPLDAQNWELVSSSDGITTPLVYTEKTASPWNIADSALAPDAYWVWNEQTYNTMVFQFHFASIIGL